MGGALRPLVLAVLLAGCLSPADAHSHPDAERSAAGPYGVGVHVEMEEAPGLLLVWGSAENEWTADLRTTGRCGTPAWEHTLRQGSVSFTPFYDAVIQCLDSRGFGPGASRPFDVRWNQTRPAGGAWQRVPPGDYLWVSRFTYFDCDPMEGGCPQEPLAIEVSFPVHVGPVPENH